MRRKKSTNNVPNQDPTSSDDNLKDFTTVHKMNYLERFCKVQLWEEIPAESLVIFRVLWGLIMCYETYTYIAGGYGKLLYVVDLKIHFPYYGFEWIRPLPGNGMYILLWLMVAASLGISIGFYYRICSFSFFIMFTFLFLQEMTLYLNHFYLICIISFLFTFLDLGDCYSVDSLFKKDKKYTLPYWNLWLLKSLIFIVYTYAGLAKVNEDWLRGEPLLHWLPKRKHIYILGQLLEYPWIAVLFSYCGLLLDMFIAPALYIPYLRPLGFLALIFFHSMNKIIFNIGVFPWVMLASTIVFVEPTTISKFLTSRTPTKENQVDPGHLSLKKKLTILFLLIFLSHQLLIPLRHWTYPGDVNWTEHGHRYSWRMKLRDKFGVAKFYAQDPRNNTIVEISQNGILTQRQQQKISCRPELLHIFAHKIAELYEQKFNVRPKVFAEVHCSLNYRPWQQMVKPGYDLAATPLWEWPYEWLVELVPLGQNSSIWFTEDPFKGDRPI